MSFFTTVYQFLLWISGPLQNLAYSYVLILATIINTILFAFVLFAVNRREEPDKEISDHRLSTFAIWSIIISIIGIEWYLLVGSLGINVGEESPDSYSILISGHWTESLKNPYYSLIDVHSVYMVIFALLGSSPIVSVFSDFPFSMAIGVFLALTLRVLSVRLVHLENSASFLLLFLALAAVPVVNLFSWFLAAPMALSLFAVYFAVHRRGTARWLIFGLLYASALLYHGSSILILLLLLFYLFIVRGRSTASLASTTIIVIIMDVLRFFYTTAYLGAGTYWGEFLKFLSYGLQTATKEPHWSAPQIPRITSYSFTVLPSLAASLILYYFYYMRISNRRVSADVRYFAYFLAGAAMLLVGLIASSFSNSLSRELGYPGFIVMAIAAAYMPRYLRGRSVRGFLLAITALAYLLSLATPTVNPWFYVGSNPIPSYTPSTYESYLMADIIASHYGTGTLFIQSSYAVPIWYTAFTHNISILQTSFTPRSLIFSSSVGTVWWG